MKLDARGIPAALRAMVPVDLMRRHRAVPFAYEPGSGKGTLVVAMAEPGDLGAQDDIAFAAGMRIRAVLASREAISEVLDAPREPRAPAPAPPEAETLLAERGIEFRPDEGRTTECGWFIPGAMTRY